MIIMTVIVLTRLIPCTMGANASQLEKDIGSDLFPANEHYFGLVSIFRVFRVPCVTPTFILTCIGPSYVFSGEFREHMLLKLCSSSTLLLQAFQRKGSIKHFFLWRLYKHGVSFGGEGGGQYLLKSQRIKAHSMTTLRVSCVLRIRMETCIKVFQYNVNPGAWVQGQEQTDKGNPAHLLGGPLLFHCHTEEKGLFKMVLRPAGKCWFWTLGGYNRSQEVHCPPEEGEGRVWQLHAAGGSQCHLLQHQHHQHQ